MVRKYRRVAVNSAKKRKISNEGEYECSTASYLNLRSRRKRLENSPPPPEQKENPNPNPNSYSKEISTFCCSSNASTELLEHQRIHFDENENENDEVEGVVTKYNSSKERRRETTACSEFGIQSEKSSDDMKTSAEKNEEASSVSVSVSGLVPEKMPTESELEDFFIAAEKNIHKRFTEKYNYDIVEDVPLEGRYEWVRLNP